MLKPSEIKLKACHLLVLQSRLIKVSCPLNPYKAAWSGCPAIEALWRSRSWSLRQVVVRRSRAGHRPCDAAHTQYGSVHCAAPETRHDDLVPGSGLSCTARPRRTGHRTGAPPTLGGPDTVLPGPAYDVQLHPGQGFTTINRPDWAAPGEILRVAFILLGIR